LPTPLNPARHEPRPPEDCSKFYEMVIYVAVPASAVVFAPAKTRPSFVTWLSSE
jgi:hypothetical protein